MAQCIRLRHLESCVAVFPARPGIGNCFHWSAALCLDMQESNLVIGTVAGATASEALAIPNATMESFLHAWVERGRDVFAPTTIEANGGLFPMDRAYYYPTNGINDVKRLGRAALLDAFRGLNLPRYLAHGRALNGGVSFVPHLLKKAGVEWTQNAAGGVVPKVMA